MEIPGSIFSKLSLGLILMCVFLCLFDVGCVESVIRVSDKEGVQMRVDTQTKSS